MTPEHYLSATAAELRGEREDQPVTSNYDLTAVAAGLRQAVTEGRYGDAQGLLLEYTSSIADLRNPAAAAEACGLMDWARKLALGRKAAAATCLAALPSAVCRYGEPRPRGAHTWDVVG